MIRATIDLFYCIASIALYSFMLFAPWLIGAAIVVMIGVVIGNIVGSIV